MVELNKDVEILCAGSNGNFNLEDTVCAGKLVSEILFLKEDAEIGDAGRAAMILLKTLGKNLLKMMKETEHGKLLIENGFSADLKVCSEYGITNIIPYFISGALKKLDVPGIHSETIASKDGEKS